MALRQTRLTLLPEKNMAVAILCNASSSDEIALWKIEWEAFAAMVPGFPGIRAIPEEKPATFVPPQELLGEWQGTVQTYQGNKPMRLSVRSGGEIAIELDGRPGGPIPIKTPLGPLGFRNGWLTGLFVGTIPTEDAKRSPHVGLPALAVERRYSHRNRVGGGRQPDLRPALLGIAEAEWKTS